MKRPYVICHILSSLDGKINGPFMGTETVAGLSREYGAIRSQMQGDAWMYGTTTTKEFTGFENQCWKRKTRCRKVILWQMTGQKCTMYLWISKGRLAGSPGLLITGAGEKPHVIEILTEATSAAYKAYLRRRGSFLYPCRKG